MDNKQFKSWFKKSGLSYRGAAELLGVDVKQVFRWVNGKSMSRAWRELLAIKLSTTK